MREEDLDEGAEGGFLPQEGTEGHVQRDVIASGPAGGRMTAGTGGGGA